MSGCIHSTAYNIECICVPLCIRDVLKRYHSTREQACALRLVSSVALIIWNLRLRLPCCVTFILHCVHTYWRAQSDRRSCIDFTASLVHKHNANIVLFSCSVSIFTHVQVYIHLTINKITYVHCFSSQKKAGYRKCYRLAKYTRTGQNLLLFLCFARNNWWLETPA